MSNILNNISSQYSHIESLQLENTNNPKYLLDLYSFIPLKSVSSISRTYLAKPKLLLIVGILLALFSLSILFGIGELASFGLVIVGALSVSASAYCLYRYFTASPAALLTIFEYGAKSRTYYGTNEEINNKFNSLLNTIYVTLS